LRQTMVTLSRETRPCDVAEKSASLMTPTAMRTP
jgi:hypothetical protein